MFPELLSFPNCYVSRTVMFPELVKPSRDTCFFCNGNNKPLGYCCAACYCCAFFLLLLRLLTANAFKGHVLVVVFTQ